MSTEHETNDRNRWGVTQWVLFPVVVFFPAVFLSERITPTGTDWSSRSWSPVSILMSWFDGTVPVPRSFAAVFGIPIVAAIVITYLKRRSAAKSSKQD